jgi:hypothetical protein
VDLGAQPMLEAAQIPGTQSVLLGGQGAPALYDLGHNLIEAGKGALNSYGSVSTFAITPNGRYLVEGSLFDLNTSLAVLTPQGKTANLCDIAGRGMTRQEWSYYVGDLAGYRLLCAGAQAALANFYNAGRQSNYSATPQFVTTPTASDVSRYLHDCTDPASGGFSVAGPFAWKPMTSNEPICTDGSLRWVIPHAAGLSVRSGSAAGQKVLVISGKLASTPGTSSASTAMVVLLPHTVAASDTINAGTVGITRTGVQFTGVQGKVLVRNTFGPDKNGYWNLLRQTPLGSKPSGGWRP